MTTMKLEYDQEGLLRAYAEVSGNMCAETLDRVKRTIDFVLHPHDAVSFDCDTFEADSGLMARLSITLNPELLTLGETIATFTAILSPFGIDSVDCTGLKRS